jgi:CubicO group peptidase (beta-lactamase class C family)
MMKRNKLLLFFIATGLFIACSKENGNNPKKEKLNIAAIEAAIDLQMKSKKIPGMQLVYVKGNQTYRFQKGVKNVNTQETVDENTVFQAASMSKPLAAYIFLKLIDRGVLSLDVPLSDYYEYDRLVKNPNNLGITARHVLLHTSGFANWTDVIGGPLDAQFAAGERYLYSGEGFQYLQKTIEHITQKSLNQLAEEEVFKPFEMTRSAFYLTTKLNDNIAAGHEVGVFNNNTNYTEAVANSAFSLLTTANDYAKFIQKVYIEGVGLSNSMFNEMVKIGVLQNTSKPNVGRGLGIGIQKNEKGIAYFHGGNNPGFKAFHMVYPADKEFFIFLSNSSVGYDLRLPFCELFFGSDITQYALQ